MADVARFAVHDDGYVIGNVGDGALQGKAPAELQVPDPKMAATFNIGGPICASVCTVLKRA
jgi:acetyl-CoA C-acetyltransferase